MAAELLEPPINVLRAVMHPKGLAPCIVNLSEWVDHALGSLRRQVAVTGDDALHALEVELAEYAREMGVPPEPARDAPQRSRSRCACAPTRASSHSSR